MKNILRLAAAFLVIFTVTGCGRNSADENLSRGQESNGMGTITLSDEITEIEKGLSAVKHSGNYGFDEFLAQGGASSDHEVVDYLMDSGIADFGNLLFGGNPFGCSTLSARDENGNALFGRNFDWNSCNAIIIKNVPDNGYASISTVNMDFISMSGIKLYSLPDNIQALAGLYAPLDGLNEKGLAVSVNMRTCFHKPSARLCDNLLSLPALKILEIRQYSCGFLPCHRQNLAANPHTSLVKTGSYSF